MNRISMLVVGVALGVAVTGIARVSAQDKERLELVRNGELVLTCHLQQGVKVVEPKLITGYDGETWIFSNGSAKSCWTK